jgi:DNA invertase Pin-like site-specific DNA recombinase
MDKEKKYLGYTRVSKENLTGKNVSIANQSQILTQEAERRGFELELVDEGEGVSGKKLSKRPVLLEALNRLDRGEAEGLIVTKLDRLARSTIDFLTILERSQRKGWALIVLDLCIDTTTPAGTLNATMMASFAQYEREIISQRTKSALAYKKSQGLSIGRASPTPQNVIKHITDLKAQRLTIRAIARELNETNFPTLRDGARWYPTTVKNILDRAS